MYQIYMSLASQHLGYVWKFSVILILRIYSLQALQSKYGVHSDQMKLAMKLVHETILQVSNIYIYIYIYIIIYIV